MRRLYQTASVLALAACTNTTTTTPQINSIITLENVRTELSVLADDSMQGRQTGTPGSARAARYIARVMAEIGLEPAGTDGFIQQIPVTMREGPRGPRVAALRTQADLDSVPAARRFYEANVIGIIRGTDPVLRDSAIVVGAHFDHIGMRRSANGADSIYNGADDDASGVVAVLEAARAMKRGPAPKRTVIFAAFTGEEIGGVGSQYYLAHPTVPLERTNAQLQIEMIARPDSLAGGRGKVWLTGFERSTMGESFQQAGLPVVADPRPGQRFFQRSDNIRFARIGIPAHTWSSFQEPDPRYHGVDDEVDTVDFEHMTAAVRGAAAAVRILADGPTPTWKPGGRPQ